MLWETFTEEQMKVWHKIDQHPHFLTEKLFPSLHQLDYVRQLISPISSRGIFAGILDDPSSVMCSVCTPDLDVVKEINDDNLHLTAVAQVVAFILRALVSPPATQEWRDAVAELGIWPVEYSDIL
ncbi:hypothetical protein ACJ73_00321 [Blastomyces percursus]|uniref:Uncharacterized protein n=1 Tax=Blastomyces percursus TaxID=1658174 RepID=A0A1J9RKY0_9EURO|nr:hypothetical protein ACJ73_00321 [Blastomyces percursus]